MPLRTHNGDWPGACGGNPQHGAERKRKTSGHETAPKQCRSLPAACLQLWTPNFGSVQFALPFPKVRKTDLHWKTIASEV